LIDGADERAAVWGVISRKGAKAQRKNRGAFLFAPSRLCVSFCGMKNGTRMNADERGFGGWSRIESVETTGRVKLDDDVFIWMTTFSSG
jgi:hypothetical protein